MPAVAQEGGGEPPGAGVVVGRVLDRESGQPVAGASVRVQRRSATADGDGAFTLRGVAVGAYQAVIGRVGYETAIETWTVGPDGLRVEARLTAMPMVLEAVGVQADRFAARARSTSLPLREFRADALARSGAANAEEFVRTRGGLILTGCGRNARAWDGPRDCVLRRGSAIRPCIVIDERPAMGGWLELSSFPPSEVYRIDVLGNGAIIQVYTRNFVAMMEARGWRPVPADVLTQIACGGIR